MVCVGIRHGLSASSPPRSWPRNSVDLPRMGVATGLVNFTRQLGGVFGVAIGAALMLTHGHGTAHASNSRTRTSRPPSCSHRRRRGRFPAATLRTSCGARSPTPCTRCSSPRS